MVLLYSCGAALLRCGVLLCYCVAVLLCVGVCFVRLRVLVCLSVFWRAGALV